MIRYLISKVIKKIRIASVIDSNVDFNSKIEAGSNVNGCSMGKHSFCGYDCDLNMVDIGSFVSIANNVIIGGNSHPVSWVSMSPVFYSGRDSVKKKYSTHQRDVPLRTVIEHDVWVGHGVHIKQGVTIHTGAVIGMGSVVTKDVLAYEIVAGVPAKHIKYRFDEKVRNSLLASEWWELSDSKLGNLAEFIKEPEMFLKKITN